MRDANSSSIGVQLKEFWNKDAVASLNSPVTLRDISKFEQKHKIELPSDFASYFLTQNGFNQSQQHQEFRGFNFWPLEEVVAVNNYDGGRFGGA